MSNDDKQTEVTKEVIELFAKLKSRCENQAWAHQQCREQFKNISVWALCGIVVPFILIIFCGVFNIQERLPKAADAILCGLTLFLLMAAIVGACIGSLGLEQRRVVHQNKTDAYNHLASRIEDTATFLRSSATSAHVAYLTLSSEFSAIFNNRTATILVCNKPKVICVTNEGLL